MAFAEDYIEVHERIAAFKEKHPEGSLQTEIVELTEGRVTVKAYAYRTPDDERPGVGHSSMTIPGKTPYTQDSEIENCETSAWGRAIAALGFEVKRGIATKQEFDNKRDASPMVAEAKKQGATPKSDKTVGDFLKWALDEHGLDKTAVLEIVGVKGAADIGDLREAAKKVQAHVAEKEPAGA